jgi:hypothetical protein
VANGQTTAITLEEYNNKCTHNKETIIDVSTIEELFWGNNHKKGEVVLVMLDKVHNIAEYRTIPPPNKIRLYGFVFEGLSCHTNDVYGDTEKFAILLRNKLYPKETIIKKNEGEMTSYIIGEYCVYYFSPFLNPFKCFSISPFS